jgi:hypothetical protein
MGRMKNVVGRDYKHNLDKASERTGTRWKG